MLRGTGGFRFTLHFLLLLILGSTGLSLLSGGCTPAPAEGKLQVMFTGNIRGNVSPCGCKVSKGGVARLASFVQRHTDPTANWLMVDAGNFVDRAGAKGGCSDKCQFLVTSYEGLKYDVLNVARQEISMGYETLVAMRDTVKSVDFVSANLVDAATNRPLFKPYVIKDYGNMKVGIIGLVRDADFPATSSLIDTTKFRVTSTKAAADRYLPEVAKKANAIVLLCELSSDDLDTLISSHPEIDFVISTGALRTGETMTTIGKTRVVGTGSSGYNGHYAMIEFNPSWGDSAGYVDFKDALTDVYEQEGEWSTKLAAFEERTGTGKRQQNAGSTPMTGAGIPNTLSPDALQKKATISSHG